MSEVRKIAYNTLAQVIGKVVTISIALVTFGIMARYLGQQGFGYYSIIYAFLSIFGILLDLGLQMTTTQLISDPKEDESQILSNALTIRLVASVIFLVLAPLAILFFPYPGIVKIGVVIAAFGFIFSSLTSTLTSFFQKNLIMQRAAIAEICAKTIFLLVLIAVVFFDFGLLGVIFASILDSFFIFVILFYFASKNILIKPRFQPQIWRKILKKTWPIALTITLNLVYFKGDILVMSLFRTQQEVGLYGAPYKILEVLINIAYLFIGLILPIMAAAVATQSYEKLKSVIQSTFDFLIILTVPMIIGGFFLGESVILIVAGPDFLISGQIIKILLIATGVIFISGVFGYAVVALDEQKKMIKFYLANAVISLIGYFIFIPIYSYWGAAWMTVFTEAFILLTAGYILRKKLKFLPNLKLLRKATVAALVMAIPLYFFSDWSFLTLFFIGAIIYFSALYLLGGIDKQMILEIVKIRKDEAA